MAITIIRRNDERAGYCNVHSWVVLVWLIASNEAEIEPDPPVALVNPQIVEAADDRLDYDGCLSFPGIFAGTVRPPHLQVTGLDEDGKRFDRVSAGFDAVVVHHEIDRPNGVLFIDRVEKFEDLYRLHKDEHGRFHRVPITTGQFSTMGASSRMKTISAHHRSVLTTQIPASGGSAR